MTDSRQLTGVFTTTMASEEAQLGLHTTETRGKGIPLVDSEARVHLLDPRGHGSWRHLACLEQLCQEPTIFGVLLESAGGIDLAATLAGLGLAHCRWICLLGWCALCVFQVDRVVFMRGSQHGNTTRRLIGRSQSRKRFALQEEQLQRTSLKEKG